MSFQSLDPIAGDPDKGPSYQYSASAPPHILPYPPLPLTQPQYAPRQQQITEQPMSYRPVHAPPKTDTGCSCIIS